MWLINTTTLKLEAFTSCPLGEYAILSHTWEDEELDLNTFASGHGREMKGYNKIQNCCMQAKTHGLDYAWVDTVCIDKRSSTELSEAINSMFSWYAAAAVCYVYLADMCSTGSVSLQAVADPLKNCRWFTRGWTLQELLAPKVVKFYARDWSLIGTKEELASVIHTITGIDENALASVKDMRKCSIAQRISWASGRKTTRIEDLAYCLLGVFDVNMPLLYGEGMRAFMRLQRTIIENSDDESIFAWSGVGDDGSGMLAKSPDCFAESGDIMTSIEGLGRLPYSMTNRGLAIECELTRYRMNTYITPLRCFRYQPDSKPGILGIYLCRTNVDDQYQRVLVDGTDLFAIATWDPCNATKRQLHIPDEAHVALAPRIGLPILSFQPQTSPVHPVIQHEHAGRSERPASVGTAGFPRQHDCHQGPLLPWRNEWWLQTKQHDLESGMISVMFPSTPMAVENCHTEPVHREVILQNFEEGFQCFDSRLLITDNMRVGFNVDFEPVCVLYTPWLPRYWFTGPQYQLFSFGNNVSYNKLDGKLALSNPSSPDLWVLRGHRSKGLEAVINTRPPHSYIKRQLVISMRPVPIDEDNVNGLVWYLKTEVKEIDHEFVSRLSESESERERERERERESERESESESERERERERERESERESESERERERERERESERESESERERERERERESERESESERERERERERESERESESERERERERERESERESESERERERERERESERESESERERERERERESERESESERERERERERESERESESERERERERERESERESESERERERERERESERESESERERESESESERESERMQANKSRGVVKEPHSCGTMADLTPILAMTRKEK
ncbi:hypothetical protein EPUS_06884 [Endocarpon pusillum Z07020]|uniref:Heterokaryon incompatibility domain-containing protein n=1 Tax=Endocarpon pusillum (strain Z07020 / HMAS-L-300199) TaxID=1263415 RepID=U1GY04_ENDPU|nr:uncharacterized protein EPUS_06884 [Endocarpon pusillum Z07020]ERF77016.1 hypothetical protein EPUS_06884 [Endocarpon pusillum Z07020]